MKTRSFLSRLAVRGFLATTYLLWALYRTSTVMMNDGLWPRPLPYPDEWLLRWHEKLDAADPTLPGEIKIHAEYPRIQTYLWCFGGLSSLLTIVSFVWLRRHSRSVQ